MASTIGKTTVSCWIKQTILHVYRHIGRSIPVSSAQCRSTHAGAFSLGDIKGISLADLYSAATWPSSLVFAL